MGNWFWILLFFDPFNLVFLYRLFTNGINKKVEYENVTFKAAEKKLSYFMILCSLTLNQNLNIYIFHIN